MNRIDCVRFNQDGSRLAVGFEGGLAVFNSEPVSLETLFSTKKERAKKKENNKVVVVDDDDVDGSDDADADADADLDLDTDLDPVVACDALYKTNLTASVRLSAPNVVALQDGRGNGGRPTPSSSSSSSSSPTVAPSLLGELSFPAPAKVLSVALRRDAVAVALSDGRAAAYSLESLRLLRSVETGANARGLLALAPGGTRTIFACPFSPPPPPPSPADEEGGGGGGGGWGDSEDRRRRGGFSTLLGGLVGAKERKDDKSGSPSSSPSSKVLGVVRVEFVDAGRSVFVRAARHPLAAIALSQSGELLAVASERGTLVRVFSLGEGKEGCCSPFPSSSSSSRRESSDDDGTLTPCLRELRRGSEPARILALAFSPPVFENNDDSNSNDRSGRKSTSGGRERSDGQGTNDRDGEEAEAEKRNKKRKKSPEWIAAASDRGTAHAWNLRSSKHSSHSSSVAAAASAASALGAAAARFLAPTPLSTLSSASLSTSAERSSFHFKLPVFRSKDKEDDLFKASLAFSPGGKSLLAAAASGGRCGLVGVALPEEAETTAAAAAAAAAAEPPQPSQQGPAELFCVPDLLGLLRPLQ